MLLTQDVKLLTLALFATAQDKGVVLWLVLSLLYPIVKIKHSVLSHVIHHLALAEIVLKVTVMCVQLTLHVNQATPVLSLIVQRAAVRHLFAHPLHHHQLVTILALALLNAIQSRVVKVVS